MPLSDELNYDVADIFWVVDVVVVQRRNFNHSKLSSDHAHLPNGIFDTIKCIKQLSENIYSI